MLTPRFELRDMFGRRVAGPTMIRRHGMLLRIGLALADGAAVIALIALISNLRFGGDWAANWSLIFEMPWAPAFLLALGWVIVLWTQGLYRLRARWSFGAQVAAMGRALAVMILLTFAALFLFKLPDVSRLFIVTLLPAIAFASLLLRGGVYYYLTALRRQGRNTRNVLIVGSGPSAVHYAREVEANSTLGLKVLGYLNGDPAEPRMGVPFLGAYGQIDEVLHRQVVDEVAVCLDLAEWNLVNKIVEVCRLEGKLVRIPIGGAFLAGAQTYVETLSGMPVLSVLDSPDRQLGLALKRLIDISVACIGLIIALPFFAVIGLAVVLDTGRPILFRQERVGLHGRRFLMVKFRTMTRDAEALRSELLHHNEIVGPAFKITDDPRITRVGRILRRTSLDELPQLWNVLRGEMSLVGPRPQPTIEVTAYDAWHRRRLSMKPGITGLWQIEARRETDFDRWVQIDLNYIDRWSLWLDVKIAARTIPALLRPEGR